MAAISQTISNVLGGVSQQPDPVKLEGQVREAENVLLDPTFGCTKRPYTQFIKKLADDIPSKAKWFSIFRDSNERFLVCIYNTATETKVRVFEANTGIERTVNIDDSASNYLTTTNPDEIKHLPISDYTFLTNPAVSVTMDSVSTQNTNKQAMVVINQVAYNTGYNIDFLRDGEELSQVKVFKVSLKYFVRFP